MPSSRLVPFHKFHPLQFRGVVYKKVYVGCIGFCSLIQYGVLVFQELIEGRSLQQADAPNTERARE